MLEPIKENAANALLQKGRNMNPAIQPKRKSNSSVT